MENSANKISNLIQLIKDQLNTNMQPKWGRMTAQHMVEHLSLLLFLSTGKWPVNPDEARAAKMKKNFFAVQYPFPKSVVMPGTDKNDPLPALKGATMEASKALLEKSFQKYLKYFEEGANTTGMHGYFGNLNFDEWNKFHEKHFEHHLMQFGLLPYPLTEEMEGHLAEIQKRLQLVYKELTDDKKALWGEMNAHQCVEHLSLVLYYSTGKFNVPFKGDLAAATAMWEPFAKADMPWRTVLPQRKFTKEPPKLRTATIEEAKKALNKAFIKYTHYCKENPNAITPHGFLGNISTAQWLLVHVKHLKHHLAQFGIEVEEYA